MIPELGAVKMDVETLVDLSKNVEYRASLGQDELWNMAVYLAEEMGHRQDKGEDITELHAAWKRIQKEYNDVFHDEENSRAAYRAQGERLLKGRRSDLSTDPDPADNRLAIDGGLFNIQRTPKKD